MYVDHQRSWFLHSSTHHGRSEGGLGGVGALVGVLLEWRHQKAQLSFYINYERQVRKGKYGDIIGVHSFVLSKLVEKLLSGVLVGTFALQS